MRVCEDVALKVNRHVLVCISTVVGITAVSCHAFADTSSSSVGDVGAAADSMRALSVTPPIETAQ